MGYSSIECNDNSNALAERKKILVVDDHGLIRFGICQLLSEIPHIEVIGQANSGESAIIRVRELMPDIVFMDIRMPGMGGLEATQRILSQYSEIKVIVVSVFNNEVYPTMLLKAGASGYISKGASIAEFKTAIDMVLVGKVYISPKLAQQLVINSMSECSSSPLLKLSQRELQIAELLTHGKRANEVAEILSISPKTINTYKYRIYEKLGVTNDVELTLAAVKYGLVDPFDIV